MRALGAALLALLALWRGAAAAYCDPEEYYAALNVSVDNWDDVKTALRARIAHNATHQPYTPGVWNGLSVLDRNPDNHSEIITIYGRKAEPIRCRGKSYCWNREHAWPQSFCLSSSGPDHDDLHMLRAADANVNSARSNLYYGECNSTTDASCVSPAHREAANDTAKNGDLFMPPAEVRGDLARAIIYQAFRYNGSGSENLVLSNCPCRYNCAMGNISVLLKWHEEDPVSDAEMLRNNLTCKLFQNNRNPFVDFPDVARTAADGLTRNETCDTTCAPNDDDDDDDFVVDDDDLAADDDLTDDVDDDAAEDLEVGDVAIVGITSSPNDIVYFVALTNIAKDVAIHFTDNGWQGSGFRDTEGVSSYTVPSGGLAAGTIFEYDPNNLASEWTLVSGGGPNLVSSGEQLLLYTGSDSSPTFVFGASYRGPWTNPDDVDSSTEGALPSALNTSGAYITVGPGETSYLYNGSRYGTADELLGWITRPGQWVNTSSTTLRFGPNLSFDVVPTDDDDAPGDDNGNTGGDDKRLVSFLSNDELIGGAAVVVAFAGMVGGAAWFRRRSDDAALSTADKWSMTNLLCGCCKDRQAEKHRALHDMDEDFGVLEAVSTTNMYTQPTTRPAARDPMQTPTSWADLGGAPVVRREAGMETL